MTLREMTEEREKQTLSPYAALAVNSKGRQRPMEPCQIRTCYQRDIDRILHSKSFRRLMHKTQVFLQPEGDHYRTRMTHTLEVARIARTIARGLGLNEDLTEAIALGHDLGHTPLATRGSGSSTEILPGGFRHNEQSLRVVDRLEKGGRGAEPDLRGPPGDSLPHGPRPGPRPWRARWSACRTRSLTSTTTSTTPCGAGSSTPGHPPGYLPGAGL